MNKYRYTIHNVCVRTYVHIFVCVCITSLNDTFLQEKAYISPFFIITTVRFIKPKLVYREHHTCASGSLVDFDVPVLLLLPFLFCAMIIQTKQNYYECTFSVLSKEKIVLSTFIIYFQIMGISLFVLYLCFLCMAYQN